MYTTFFDTIIIFSPQNAETSSVQSGTNLIAVISSIIIVYAVSSIVIFFIGYACGWFGLKHKLSRASKAASDSVEKNTYTCHMEQSQTPGPLYEELHQESALEHQNLVELKENVAYGPIIAR